MYKDLGKKMAKVKIDLDIDIQTIEHNGKKYKITVDSIDDGYCICGCGEKVVGRSKYYNAACRQRVCRRKKKEAEKKK